MGKKWDLEVEEEDKTLKSVITRTCHSFEKDSKGDCHLYPIRISIWGILLREIVSERKQK